MSIVLRETVESKLPMVSLLSVLIIYDSTISFNNVEQSKKIEISNSTQIHIPSQPPEILFP